VIFCDQGRSRDPELLFLEGRRTVQVFYAGGLRVSGKAAAKIAKPDFGLHLGAFVIIKMIGLLTALLCAPALATTMAAPPEATGQDSHVVTGTLEELDLSKMSGKIKTDLAQTVGFTIQNPDLFKGLSVGERIAVRLDDQGRVVKVMATTLPELPIPEK